MSLVKASYPHAIIFNDAVDDIFQMSSVGSAYNDEDISEMCSSGYGPEFLGTGFSSPDVTFDTAQLGAMMARCTVGNVAKSFVAGNVDLEYRAGQNLGFRAAWDASAHVRGRLVNSALLYWTGMSASMGQRVSTVSAKLVTAWNEISSDPLVWSKNNALDSAICPVTELYGMGPVVLNGALLTGVTSWDWQNNVTLESIAADGVEFNTYQGIKTMAPVVTIQTHDIDLLSDLGQRGVAITALTVFARRYKESDIFETNATAKHIKLVATAGTIKARKISDSPATVELVARLKIQGDGNFWTPTVNSTITTGS